jgi:ribosomal protein S1
MPNMEDASLAQQEESLPTEQTRPVQENEFDRLLNSYSQFSQPPLGSLLRGHVVKIAGSEVIVDVGYKCEGVISAEEFKDSDGKLRI